MGRRLLLVLALGGIVVTVRADGVVLHEYVPGLSEDALVLSNGSGEPVGMIYEGALSTEPSGEHATRDEHVLEATPAPNAFGGTREPPSYRPDRLTSMHSSTGYFEVFTPSVAPFKRVTSYDRVAVASDGTPVLTAATDTRPLPVVGLSSRAADGRERDRFLGSVVVDFTRGTRVAIPSVSPESRILHVRTEPAVPVHFEVDPAGNQFVVLDGPAARETRVTFVTDAPRGYFNQTVPTQAAEAEAASVPAMPRAVRDRALVVARELGVRPGDPLAYALEVLVEHFRSFREAEAPPHASGDIYLDLARGGVGVCRHRAYAFVITAQALGIPAHYVENEAHAWVEVKLGDAGWSRIDLGGSSRGVEGHGLDDRPAYAPTAPDPFPQPASYVAAQEAARASSQAFAHAADVRAPSSLEPSSSTSAAASRSSTDAAPQVPPREPPSSESPDAEPRSPPTPSQALASVSLLLDGTDFRAYRGRALELHGRALESDGTPISGLRIEFAVHGARERRLGTTLTRDDGSFDASLGVPPDLPVADYALVVRTPGDATHGPAELR